MKEYVSNQAVGMKDVQACTSAFSDLDFNSLTFSNEIHERSENLKVGGLRPFVSPPMTNTVLGSTDLGQMNLIDQEKMTTAREQEMRMGDMGPRGAINIGDAFNPAPAGNQGPPPMMGMNMNNRAIIPGPPMGPGPAMGPEGAANMGTPMMPDNGAVLNRPQALLTGSGAGSSLVYSPPTTELSGKNLEARIDGSPDLNDLAGVIIERGPSDSPPTTELSGKNLEARINESPNPNDLAGVIIERCPSDSMLEQLSKFEVEDAENVASYE
ncbi:hypothetical protein CR201_G0055969 [Pongo abelii]|uniref:Uncharacterized protein n=1 Tax=Pongo abelii TaxID=9601 RepID=A0A2J8QZ10_PONAB|nr:hypothetical protein CR201_G0055969 [Pongo abelii]